MKENRLAIWGFHSIMQIAARMAPVFGKPSCAEGDDMAEKKRYNWIDESIIIDFDIPKIMTNLILDMEQLDEEENYGYLNYCDALDDMAKEFYVQGKLTKAQWDTLVRKYGGIYK